jgi:hypothetical protein
VGAAGPSIGPEPAYRRAAGVVWRDLEDEALVGRPGHGIERLAGAAFAVWTALETPGTVRELVARLGAEADGGGAAAEEQVQSALALLERDGLVSPEP